MNDTFEDLTDALEGAPGTSVTGAGDTALATGSSGNTGSAGESAAGPAATSLAPVSFSGSAALAVDGGRATTLELDTARSVASVEIVNGPAHGTATVNPDNSIALVLSGSSYSGALSFDYKVTFGNGTTEAHTVTLDVAAPEQDAGWGKGLHYMLETDANGDLVIETGDNHRKVYVSGSNDALSRADIAALEGVSEATVTTDWLLDHPEYGGSEGKALATDVGMELWYAAQYPSEGVAIQSSNWLMFEKGYTYEDTGSLFYPGTSGESALQPVYISSWGSGARPVLNDEIKIFQLESAHIVIDDIAPAGGITNLGGENLLINDSEFTGRGLNVQNLDGLTIRDSDFSDIVYKVAVNGYWQGGGVGLFTKLTNGILLEDNIFHHNGWEDDYLPDNSTDGGMAPSMFSHNIYLQNNTTDVTFRDNIVSQGASYGAQIRGGGFVEDNVFVDNNAAVNVLGGVYEGEGPIGNYTFFTDNLITSGAHKTWTHGGQGGLTLGLTNAGYDTTLLDNIIAHLADPNNPAELAEKYQTHSPLTSANEAYDNTIIYNWRGNDPSAAKYAVDNNTPGLDTNLADQTTIQNFAAALLGQNKATIAELMDAILAGTAQASADDIIAYFQAGFGVGAGGNGSATDHRFIPNALAGGIRWDNRINWDTEELPGNGDSAALGGNQVQYGGTTQLRNLDLQGGSLFVNHGKLTVDGKLATKGGAGTIQTVNAGQFWTDGYAGGYKLKIEVDGGRFANTGDITGKTLLKATDGQTILATAGATYTLTSGSELRITGSGAKVGFDGEIAGALSLLSMQDGSLLTFDSDAAGFSTIEEFRSGHWDHAAPAVKSMVLLDGTLRVDLADYTSGTGLHTLIKVDELAGRLDGIEIAGLSSSLDATVVANYKTDTVFLKLASGSGQTEFKESGNAATPGPTPQPEPEPGEPQTGTENDDILGGTPDGDLINGLGGNDKIRGRGGDDILMGKGGRDTLSGGSGKDEVSGGSGSDILKGRGGRDTLSGGSGNDDLRGGGFHDVLSGGKGADTLTGGRGNDTMSGGDDRDIFHFGKNHGADTITGFTAGEDLIRLGAGNLDFGGLGISASGNDTVIDTGAGTIRLQDFAPGDLSAADFQFGELVGDMILF